MKLVCLNCQIQIVLNHHIGEQVIIGDAAVLVRSLTEQQICLSGFGTVGIPAEPKAGGFHKHFGSPIQIKRFIAGFLTIGIQREGNICSDMQLAASDIPGFTLFAAIQGYRAPAVFIFPECSFAAGRERTR